MRLLPATIVGRGNDGNTPAMTGVTFAVVGPMVAMAGNPQLGIFGIYGAVIAAGIFGIVVAPLMSSLVRFFPPVVTGTIITVIGISLMRVGINWAAGGQPTIRQMVDGTLREVSNPAFGAPESLAIALLVLVVIVLIARFAKGFIANIAVLGLFPKLAQVAASVPQYVLGGAGLVMFGTVAATGIKILSAVDFSGNRNHLFIVAIGAGMIPLVAPTFFAQMPKVLAPVLYSGILLAASVAVTLNTFFNGGRNIDSIRADSAANTVAATKGIGAGH